VAFSFELSSVYVASQDACVCKRELAFFHMKDGLCFLLHLWMCTPHATSSESLLARKGVVEYACFAWSGLEVPT
jgi:hypothetical protein